MAELSAPPPPSRPPSAELPDTSTADAAKAFKALSMTLQDALRAQLSTAAQDTSATYVIELGRVIDIYEGGDKPRRADLPAVGPVLFRKLPGHLRFASGVTKETYTRFTDKNACSAPVREYWTPTESAAIVQGPAGASRVRKLRRPIAYVYVPDALYDIVINQCHDTAERCEAPAENTDSSVRRICEWAQRPLCEGGLLVLSRWWQKLSGEEKAAGKELVVDHNVAVRVARHGDIPDAWLSLYTFL